MSFIKHIPLLDTVKLPKLAPNERLILTHLCLVARDGDDFAWLSPKKLQARTGITHRTNMNTCIRNMVKKGLLSRAFGPNTKGRYVDGFVLKLDQFSGNMSGCITSTPETNNIYPLDVKGLPPEIKDIQHMKAVRKHMKAEEIAGGENKEIFLKEIEKKVKTKLENFITKNLEEDVKEMFSKKKEMPNPYLNLSAKDISKLKIKNEPPVKKIHSGTLCTVWKMCHAEFYPDIFIGQPTMAERAIFRNFLKFATPEHAVAALYFAVKYWISFVKFCQKNGAVGKPPTPKIKYLLKYVKQSVTFYTTKQNSITGVYSNLVQQQNIEGLGLFEPLSENKVPEVKIPKESGSEPLSDVPMNLKDANKLYKKLFQKGKA